MHVLEWARSFWSRWRLADTWWEKPLHVAQLMVLREGERRGLNVLGYTGIQQYHEILEFQRLGEHVVYFIHLFVLQNAIKVSPKRVWCVPALSQQLNTNRPEGKAHLVF